MDKSDDQKKKILTRIILPSLIIVGCLSFWLLWMNDRASNNDPIGNYPIKRHVKYTLTLENVTGRSIDKAKLWLFTPVAQDATQKLEQIEVPGKYRVFKDDIGNQILYFEFDDLAESAAPQVTLEAVLLQADSPNSMLSHNVERYLRKEITLDIGSQEIVTLSEQLRGETEAETVRNILTKLSDRGNKSIRVSSEQRVPSRKTESEISDPRIDTVSSSESISNALTEKRLSENALQLPEKASALAVLRGTQVSRTGDLYLLTALCRTLGIPARGVIGAPIVKDEVIHSDDLTVWAEFHDGEKWQIADLDKRKVADKPSNYLALRKLETLPETVDWDPFEMAHDSTNIGVVRGSLKIRMLNSL